MLEIVTDKSQEGSQFVKGFGGIGGKVYFLKKMNIIKKWHYHILAYTT